MKKIFSLILSAVLVLTVIFVPMVGRFPSVEALATTQSSVVIENTFDEENWNPLATSNLLKEEITDGSNGNALRFNKVTSVTATTGNAIRHYKIFNPEKVAGGYIDYKPSANTTYKLTFRYRTRSLLSYNIFINVRSVANDTVGDVLCRAVTVKKTLGLTTNDDYKWDTAVAYFKTPVDAIDALAISVEYNSAADSTGAFNVAIDDVKLETAPSSFVVANTFEEDDVTPPLTANNNVGTLNYGTDTGIFINSGNNINEVGYSTSSFGSANSVTARTNSTLGFRAARKDTTGVKYVHFEIYDYSQGKDANGKLKSFVPEFGANYRITFDYKVAASSNKNILFNIRPVTVDGSGNRNLGDVIATAVTIPAADADHKTSAWKTAVVNVPIAAAYDSLALTVEITTESATTYTFIDNIVVHKFDSNVIINDYEETILGKGNNATTMASTKITGANLFHLGTKPAATPNTSRVLQFERITGQTVISSGNYTYVEIYNPYDVDFAGFSPKANKYYKLSFDYKVKLDADGTISFNVRGKTGDTLGDVITTAATVSPDDTYFTDYAWDNASVLINTEGKAYETLAISIEISAANNDGNYPYLDNIVLEEVDESGETTFTVHHDSAICGKENEVITKNNLTLFSDITFEDTNTARFEGLYFDSEFTKPATGIVYGTTDVYAKWKDISKFVNTYDANGVTKDKLVGTGITYYGKGRPDVAPNTSNVIQFNNVYGQNNLKKGNIIHAEIYNPNDRNFTTSEKLPSFKPTKDSVYKITFEYKIKNSATSNISFNIRGKKDGQFSDILGTAVVIESGDPYYSSSIWEKAEVYIYTEGVEYDALALTIESDGLTNANLWPYIDNIWVEGVKEYKSGVISTVAPADNNKSGLLAINNGKWFEVDKDELVNVSFKLDTAAAIPNSSVVASIISDNGDVENVTLFDFSEKSGENLYATTFKASACGKVAISVHKNDNTAVNQEVVLSDLDIDTYNLCALKGDSNIDGAIDILDLVHLKESTDANYTVDLDYRIYADVNKNGDLDEADIEGVRELILNVFNYGSLDAGVEYTFNNAGTGSAEGTIALTSNEAVDNIVEIYWGANGKKLDTYNFIGSTRITPNQSVNFELASHFAIPEGATQIIISDGVSTKTLDIAERYDAAFDPQIIKLVKDYTVEKNVANVKVVYNYDLKNWLTNDNVVSERYDLINEFRSNLSDALGADVELVNDLSLNDNQNYIILGDSRFSESTALLNSIKSAREDYHADFGIKADGKKIFINAPNDYALQFACDYFLTTYCDNGNTAIDKGISHSSLGELKEITLADVDINSYTVVYPQIATVLEVDAAKYLVANIVKATGKAPLTIANDSKAVGDYEILIGNTNRTDDGTYATTAEATADNSYTITVEEKRTIITGGTNSAVNAAVIDFTDRLMTGALAIGTYSGKYDGKFTLTNGYKLTWSDEFNGTALSSTWQKLELNYPTIAGGKVQWDNTNNTVVENGALKVTAGKIAGTNDTTGVSLDTATNKLIKYGYFEARIKSFDQAGYINGFWGSTIGEKASFIDGKSGTYYGEFDILEMYETQGLIKPNLHNHCDGEATSKNYLQGDDGSKPEISVADIGSKYHNFAMQWTDDYIYFYLDGVKYYSFDCSALSEYEVFDMVTRIRLTFSAGKYVTPTAESDEAFVDWVRVWQRNEAGYVVK